ncbi:carbonic anhydrase 2 isoform X2 [Hydra vulgaris]|nr:carbonic anhydrase 2 isoform X2 [Hydra vulgaris]XP_047124708.1 carbonic anhydrase 2 isoform X2 [Hydra vulgaris]
MRRLLLLATLSHFFTATFAGVSSHSDDWAYNSDTEGPQFWAYAHPLCNGTRQSPINIIMKETIYNETLTPLVPLNYSTVFNDAKYYLANNGHTVNLGIEMGTRVPIGLIWKGKQYYYHELHFHWGENDQHGSEHYFNNQSYALEVHIVHYLNDYGDFDRALNYSDGILVWSSVFQTSNSSETSNTLLQDVFNNIDKIINAENKTYIKPLPLSSFVSENSTGSYYHYEGSLTSPDCTESVMWIVNHKMISVSSDQLLSFRLLKGRLHNTSNSVWLENLTNTDRPTQPINGRKVFTSVLNYPNSNFFNKNITSGNNSTSYLTPILENTQNATQNTTYLSKTYKNSAFLTGTASNLFILCFILVIDCFY